MDHGASVSRKSNRPLPASQKHQHHRPGRAPIDGDYVSGQPIVPRERLNVHLTVLVADWVAPNCRARPLCELSRERRLHFDCSAPEMLSVLIAAHFGPERRRAWSGRVAAMVVNGPPPEALVERITYFRIHAITPLQLCQSVGMAARPRSLANVRHSDHWPRGRFAQKEVRLALHSPLSKSSTP